MDVAVPARVHASASASGLAVVPFVLGISVMAMPRAAKVRVIRNHGLYELVACLLWMTVEIASLMADA
jgi:hypothetical protein